MLLRYVEFRNLVIVQFSDDDSKDLITYPPGCSESVFYALPDFIQQKIVDQQSSTSFNEQKQQQALSAGYDFDTFVHNI